MPRKPNKTTSADRDTIDAALLSRLKEKAAWVWRETLKIHGTAPETRIASSLSPVEILVTLYYGNVLRFDPHNPRWEERDRFIASKGHGCVSLYPILADVGFIGREELAGVCKAGSRLGGIPDTNIPGIETTNGSLGHGLGVACGMALALKQKRSDAFVYVLVGDGELYEGAVWEAVMFAGQNALNNLILIVDNNGIAMLDYCRNIINLDPLDRKLREFRWDAVTVDGHDVAAVHQALSNCHRPGATRPQAIVAKTVKGRGVPQLENNALCHVKTLNKEEIAAAIGRQQ
jgi:transketolase